MKRPTLVQLQSVLPHGIGLGLIIILLLAAQGFIAEHPALAALLVFAFSVPYLGAAVRARRPYYLYGGMLLGAASYFMACHALGAPVAWFPPLSVPLVWALWLVGWWIRRKLPPEFDAFAATTFRAMNITVAAFTFQALWQLPALLNPAGALGGIAGSTLIGYACLYLVHGLVFQLRLYAWIFSVFGALGFAVGGATLGGRDLLAFWLEAAAFAVLLAATGAHKIAGTYLSRNYYLSFAAITAAALAAIWIEPAFGLYVPAITAAAGIAGYLLLVRAVGDPRGASSSERLLARLLVVTAAACAGALTPFVLIPPLAAYWTAPALIAGIAFGWLAWRRRADRRNHRNLSVYPAALFLTAAAAVIAAGQAHGAYLPAAAALAAGLVMLVLHRLSAPAPYATSERALGEALSLPVFLAWYFPLLANAPGVALGASIAGLAILLAGAALRGRGTLLCGAGPAVAGAWLAVAPNVAGAAGAGLWVLLACAAAIAGVAFGAAFRRSGGTARFSLGLFWLILSALGVLLAWRSSGMVAAVYVSVVMACAALVVAGFLRRGPRPGLWFPTAASLIAAFGMAAVTALGVSGAIDLQTVALSFLGLAASGAAGWLIGRGIWVGRAGFAAFAVAGILLAYHRTPGLPYFMFAAAIVPAALFATGALLRKLDAALARSALAVAHAASATTAALLLVAAYGEPASPLLAASLAPQVVLYAIGAAASGSKAFRFGAGGWLGMLALFGAAASSREPYAANAMLAGLIAAVWLAAGYALRQAKRIRWSSSAFLLSTSFGCGAALLVAMAPHSETTWQVFAVAGAVFAALAILLRQDIHVYLVMLVMAMMVYDWVRASTSHFTQDVLYYPVVAVACFAVFLLLPVLKKTANRLAALPVFGIFSIWGVAIIMLPVLGAAAFLMSAYSLKVTAHPRFCTSCHYMDEYYDSWQHSSHKSVACIECHYEPGIKNEIAGKGAGMIQLIKYVSHSYTNRPHGIVSNASCMREGCHQNIADSGQTLLFNKKIRFRHDKHLKGHPRGQDLNCVSCHGQMVQGTHIGVTETTCLTCHFYKRGEKPTAAGDCLSCHSVLDETVKIGNETFDHPAFLADKSNVGCTHCHSQVTQGAGEVSKVRCRSCHLENYGPVKDPEAFHLIHVRKKHFDCLQCHDEIRHGTRPMDQQVDLSSTNCNACHGGERHTVQQRVYAGTAAKGLESMPDFMYVAGVTCDGCHTHQELLNVGEMTLTGKKSGAKECADCHNDEYYGEMLTEWQTEVRGRIDELQKNAAGLKASIQGMPEQKGGEARSLLESAKSKLEIVELDGSDGAHNYFYVTSILDSVAENLDACSELVESLNVAAANHETASEESSQ